mmetsp:Transcript_57215/g.85212  ORF Transcript_57215/g.85212 Transcript_57215/m.85212 type:complete len:96 (+) Transcript_57215:1115-1402(+)
MKIWLVKALFCLLLNIVTWFHFFAQMRQPPEEILIIERIFVLPFLQTEKAPFHQLTQKSFHGAFPPVSGQNLAHKLILFVNSPRAAMRHPRDNIS